MQRAENNEKSVPGRSIASGEEHLEPPKPTKIILPYEGVVKAVNREVVVKAETHGDRSDRAEAASGGEL
jgi:hypothetical protein